MNSVCDYCGERKAADTCELCGSMVCPDHKKEYGCAVCGGKLKFE